MTTCFRTTVGLVAALLLTVGGTGCDGDGDSSREQAERESPRATSEPAGGDDSAESDRDEHDHAMRLGLKMQDIGHRWAAIWYSGNAGRVELLDYQVHELRETIEQIERANVEEHGLDVGDELDARVGSRAEELVGAVENGEQEKFRNAYREILESCNSCHAATDHGFIDVTVPERNPYPNVRLSSEEAE